MELRAAMGAGISILQTCLWLRYVLADYWCEDISKWTVYLLCVVVAMRFRASEQRLCWRFASFDMNVVLAVAQWKSSHTFIFDLLWLELIEECPKVAAGPDFSGQSKIRRGMQAARQPQGCREMRRVKVTNNDGRLSAYRKKIYAALPVIFQSSGLALAMNSHCLNLVVHESRAVFRRQSISPHWSHHWPSHWFEFGRTVVAEALDRK